MAEGEQKPPPLPGKNAKGQFVKGHTFAKGRAKGDRNKFGPGLREKLMAGIAAAGERKARKAGKNGKVDGVDFYLEQLFDTSNAAAATLLSKLIPAEKPPEISGAGVTINIHPIASGTFLSHEAMNHLAVTGQLPFRRGRYIT